MLIGNFYEVRLYCRPDAVFSRYPDVLETNVPDPAPRSINLPRLRFQVSVIPASTYPVAVNCQAAAHEANLMAHRYVYPLISDRVKFRGLVMDEFFANHYVRYRVKRISDASKCSG